MLGILYTVIKKSWVFFFIFNVMVRGQCAVQGWLSNHIVDLQEKKISLIFMPIKSTVQIGMNVKDRTLY